MEKGLDDIMNKVQNIKQEMDKVEFRVLNTKTHLEQVEKSMDHINKEIIEGFHSVSVKINKIEEDVRKLESLIEQLINKN